MQLPEMLLNQGIVNVRRVIPLRQVTNIYLETMTSNSTFALWLTLHIGAVHRPTPPQGSFRQAHLDMIALLVVWLTRKAPADGGRLFS
jgi:hypothetical protein